MDQIKDEYYAVIRFDKTNKRFSIGVPTKVSKKLELAPKDYLKVTIKKIAKA
jgi:hypothetical protein